MTPRNGAFVMEQSRALARELVAAHSSDADLLRFMWLQILLREPDSEEAKLAAGLFARQTENTGARLAAVSEMVRGLLNLNEFLYVD